MILTLPTMGCALHFPGREDSGKKEKNKKALSYPPLPPMLVPFLL